MMKRTGVARLAPDDAPAMQQTPVTIQQQPGVSNMHTLAHTAQPQIIAGATTMLSVSGAPGFGRGRATGPPPVINYLKQSPLQYAAPKPTPQIGLPARIKEVPPSPPAQAAQFQRLKVEDALHYLDQVKYKFNAQPQVYNDFLDIMKEFKSQTIDTPGVITRVSNLFKGHPQLIVGFNTFLPPGYKIEVQSNGQVSVSMPSPSSLGGAGVGGVGGVLVGVHHPPQPQLVHLLPVPQPVNTNAIVHNLSVNAAPANTLHHISQAHQQIEAAAIHHPQGGVSSGAAHAPAPAGQPVEFNHAIEYVNKIKSRFIRQPDKYKRFLEILHAYQRGHRDLKPQNKQQTEQEVYAQVAKLFENQDDLLAEFGQFLPDAKAGAPKAYAPSPPPVAVQREESLERFPPAAPSPPPAHPPAHPPVPKHVPTAPAAPAPHHLKRSPSFTASTQSAPPPLKRPRASPRDVSVCEAAKSGTAHEYAYFDRVRKALKHQHVYDNFLRCLLLFTREVISSSELLCVTAPFLVRHPELQRWLHDFVLPNDHSDGYPPPAPPSDRPLEVKPRYEPVPPLGAQLRHDRPQGDAAMDIDLSTCKRLGTSYCALPRGSADALARRCSGRTPLCREVLNDTWVSFPTWSEDSTFVTSRKTQYEEYIYRCEDERFELDVVIETNASTIRVLEGVQKKLARMTPEDAAKYRLDDCLGGHSPTIHQRALRRIYGEKAVDIIAGLKKNPAVAVPVVLRRLKAKEEEWREAQKGFNKQWREQNEKYYLKSLDHQGINFKQNDLKALRSKSLFNEVESAFTARKAGPHVVVDYNVKTRQEAIKIVRDAAELLIHHARRQTAIQKAEKRRIKQILRQFIPDLLNHPKQPLSDDENDEDKEDAASPGSPMDEELPATEKGNSVKLEKQESSESDNNSDKSLKNNKNNKENTPKNNNNTDSKEPPPLSLGVKRSSSSEDSAKVDVKTDTDLEDDYRDHPPHESRFVCSSSWYLFLRLHGALVQRLAGARGVARAEGRAALDDAHRLRLRPHNLPASVGSPADYYPALLELVKAVLDGNMEPSAYEDAAREMFGIKAYPAYTLDKIVSYAVRQLQHCVTEHWSVQCYSRAARRSQRAAATYVRRALAERPRHHTALLVTASGGDECKMSFELLEGATDGRSSPLHDSRLSPHTQRQWPPSPPPVFLGRAARRGGAGWARAAALGPAPPPKARRRKPDQQGTGPPLRARLLSGRPCVLYRPGSLSAARAVNPRLAARRAERFRAWLRTKRD